MLKYLFICFIKFYKACLSPFLPASCLYKTSCSTFMLFALEKHGFFLGSFFGIKRILSCNSFLSNNKKELHV